MRFFTIASTARLCSSLITMLCALLIIAICAAGLGDIDLICFSTSLTSVRMFMVVSPCLLYADSTLWGGEVIVTFVLSIGYKLLEKTTLDLLDISSI